MKVLRAAFLLAALSPPLSAQQPSTPADTVVTVQGIVRDARTNKPIPHALVSSQDRTMAVFSGREGRFEFAARVPKAPQSLPNGGGILPTGNFTGSLLFNARKPGYLPDLFPVLWTTQSSASGNFVELKLTPEAILKGHISTPGFDTPANVAIQLMRRQVQDGRATWVRTQQASTNSQGEFRIANLPAGDYKVMSLEWVDNAATAVATVLPGRPGPQRGPRAGRQNPLPSTTQTGFPPVFYPNGSSEAAATPIHIEAGQTVSANLNLHPEPYFPVRIPILNTEGGQGLNVRVTTADGNTGFSLGLNNARHTVEGALPKGTYEVEVNSFGPNPLSAATRLTVAGAVSGAPAEASPITLGPSETIPVIVHEDFTAAGTNGDSGVVNGNGQRQLSLFLRSENGEQSAGIRNQSAGDSGPPLLENIRPGRYEIQSNSFHGYVASATSGGVDLLHNPLVVGAGGTAPPIEVTLRDDSATLTGTVALPPPSASDPAQTGISVYCFPVGGGSERFIQGYAGPDGKFTMENVPPGSYLVAAIRKQNPLKELEIEYRNPEVLRPFRTRDNQITLAPGAQATIELEVTPYDGD